MDAHEATGLSSMQEAISLVLGLITPLILLIAAKRLSVSVWLSPLTLVAAQVLIGVTFKLFFLLLDPNYNQALRWGYEPSKLVEASTYVFAFCFLVVAGYWLAYRPRSLHAAHRAANWISFSKSDVRLLIWVSIVVTILLFMLLAAQKQNFSSIFSIFESDDFRALQRRRIERIEGVEGFGNSFFTTIVFFSVNSLVFVILTTLIFWKESVGQDRLFDLTVKAGLIICCVFILLEVSVTGRRNLLAFYMLIFGAIAMTGVRPVSFSLLVKYVIAFSSVVAFFSVLTLFRGPDEPGTGGFAVFYEGVVGPLFYAEYFLSITKMTVILSQVTTESMLWGRSLVEWVAGIIPRPLWPTKPAISLGPFVKTEIYGAGGTIGGIPPTFPGELYINFMWAGLFLAPVYGYLIRMFENFCFEARHIARYGSHWIYYFLIVPMTYGLMQNAVGGAMINSIIRLAIALLILFVLLKIPKRFSQARNITVGGKSSQRKRFATTR